jgi:hypothetical protein
MTHTRYGRSQLSSLGQLTYSRRSDGAPETDGGLREVARTKIRHYRHPYINRPDPIVFMPVTVDTSGRVYDDFSRLLFLYAHREASVLSNEIPEESEQLRFLRVVCYAKAYYQAFFRVLIDLIVELFGLIIKPFYNQTDS